ncbi:MULTISPECIES: cobalamin biosynthesis protein [unclassified Dietzia]|uniref:cobalamin biosynthesis protein n=2 Tax=Dietzia TaxID=37914 RepID=UPI000D215E96|nr:MULTISPECIES: cobalamin biosynthesis protein [unclassified Dietzia]AVZ39097.1 cobalamin biosynthesis protein [Dietzia sp. JS16-p6b]QGW24290.1 cobalamin biosynthesis protein [Dietzia sp. DQ12-45-1b]
MNTHLLRALGTALGFAADAAIADPVRWHPVAGFGRCASALEQVLHPDTGRDDTRTGTYARGLAYTVVLVGGTATVVGAAEALAAGRPVVRVGVTAITVWSCLGGTSLLRVAERHADLLERGDVPASRLLLPWLCGRDPDLLDADDLARAVVESVAENTSDAAVATMFWAAVAGPAGAAAHRAANTLDAMVGHRSTRYLDFGRSSARLDDALGWPAARLAALLTAALAPVVGGSPRAVLSTWRRDARAHPSPNAGVIESACAGALGVRLGGRTPYPHGVEMRPHLGGGRAPRPEDVRRAIRLMRATQVAAAVCAVAAQAVLGAVVTGAAAARP